MGYRGFCIVIMVLTLAWSCARHQLPARPVNVEIARLQAAWIEDTSPQDPALGELRPPEEGVLPGSPTRPLYDAIGTLDEVLATKRIHQKYVSKAQSSLFRAAGLNWAPGQLDRFFESLSVSSRLLEGSKGVLSELAPAPAETARRVSESLLDLAIQVGASPSLIARARETIRSGEAHFAAGRYTQALSEFAGVWRDAAEAIRFDIDRFETNIIAAVQSETVGYAYAITQNRRLHRKGSGGFARTATDPPRTPQSPFREMYIASISKTITAVAVLKALDEVDLSVDDKIVEYLPPTWTLGPNVEPISFASLLRHTSNLDRENLGGEDLDALRDHIAEGRPNGGLGFTAAQYRNVNYSLLRVLLPRMRFGGGIIATLSRFMPEEAVYSALFSGYVKRSVFDPIGVSTGFCSPTAPPEERTLYYDLVQPGSNGVDYGNWQLLCGATGWYLSAVDLARFLVFLRHTDLILDEDLRTMMDERFFGWLNPNTFGERVSGRFGDYRAHGGRMIRSNRGFLGCAMNFPIEIEATLLINSEGSTVIENACSVLRDAFDGAWISN